MSQWCSDASLYLSAFWIKWGYYKDANIFYFTWSSNPRKCKTEYADLCSSSSYTNIRLESVNIRYETNLNVLSNQILWISCASCVNCLGAYILNISISVTNGHWQLTFHLIKLPAENILSVFRQIQLPEVWLSIDCCESNTNKTSLGDEDYKLKCGLIAKHWTDL